MIKSHLLELPISRTNFHGPKDVRAIEDLPYIFVEKEDKSFFSTLHLHVQPCLSKQCRIHFGKTLLMSIDNIYFHPETCLYKFDPLKPHFYIVKLGFTMVYIIFLISAQKHKLWVCIRTASLRQF